MNDASLRPNASAATSQPEAQITTTDVIERFTLDIEDVPREALDQIRGVLDRYGFDMQLPPAPAAVVPDPQQWLEQAKQCPSWCTQEHPEPDLESTQGEGFHHDGEVEAVEVAAELRDGEGYLYVKLAQFVPGVASGQAPRVPVLELSSTYRTVGELQLTEARELTDTLRRMADIAAGVVAPTMR